MNSQINVGKGLAVHRHGIVGPFPIQPVKEGAAVKTTAADLEQLRQPPHPEAAGTARVIALEMWAGLI
ncbi:MAG: hypothetical protein MK082_00580 [Phycisphaerales bacterium]|nr:hypothetical protein [Phycisphaerales bacterium]